MTLRPSTVVVRSGSVLASEIDGEAVMLSIEHGAYYGLDEVGTDIWNLVAKPRSIADICAALGDRYEVDRETCQREVTEFLRVLVQDGTVTVLEEAP